MCQCLCGGALCNAFLTLDIYTGSDKVDIDTLPQTKHKRNTTHSFFLIFHENLLKCYNLASSSVPSLEYFPEISMSIFTQAFG